MNNAMNACMCANHDPNRSRRPQRRQASLRGFSMLEMIVAMVVLGIAMAGLLPLAIQHSRQVRSLEGCNPQTGRWRCAEGTWTYGSDTRGQYPDQWYITPSSDAWAKKLCAAALLSSGTTLSPPIAPLPVYFYDSTLNANAVLADNSTSGFYGESDPDWLDGPAIGYLGNSRRHSAGTEGTAASSDYAVWTFQNVPPGWYVVEATWPDPSVGPFPQKAGVDLPATPSACFVLYDVTGNRSLYTATVDQSQAVTGDPYDGYTWQPVMTAYVPSHIWTPALRSPRCKSG